MDLLVVSDVLGVAAVVLAVTCWVRERTAAFLRSAVVGAVVGGVAAPIITFIVLATVAARDPNASHGTGLEYMGAAIIFLASAVAIAPGVAAGFALGILVAALGVKPWSGQVGAQMGGLLGLAVAEASVLLTPTADLGGTAGVVRMVGAGLASVCALGLAGRLVGTSLPQVEKAGPWPVVGAAAIAFVLLHPCQSRINSMKPGWAEAQLKRESVGALLRDARAVDPKTRHVAVAELGQRARAGQGERDELREVLVASLRDDSADVRKAATASLAALRDPRAIPALREALDDPAALRGALGALMVIGGDEAWAILGGAARGSHAVEVVEAMSGCHKREAIPVLLEAAEDPRPDVRHIAVGALGTFHDERVLPALVKALDDPSTREIAGLSLCRQGDARGMPIVSAMLKSGDPYQQRVALMALERLRDPKSLAMLQKAAKDPDPTVSGQAVQELRRRGVSAGP